MGGCTRECGCEEIEISEKLKSREAEGEAKGEGPVEEWRESRKAASLCEARVVWREEHVDEQLRVRSGGSPDVFAL
jgi:hypothetical protein